MLLGIISDTHDYAPGMDKALEFFRARRVGLVLHCGDWITPNSMAYFHRRCADLQMQVRGVFGNNDLVAAAMMRDGLLLGGTAGVVEGVLEIAVAGRRVAVCHGHDQELLAEITHSGKFDAVFTGHTHRARSMRIGETLVVNPGSTAFELPRTARDIATVALYDPAQHSVDIAELD